MLEVMTKGYGIDSEWDSLLGHIPSEEKHNHVRHIEVTVTQTVSSVPITEHYSGSLVQSAPVQCAECGHGRFNHAAQISLMVGSHWKKREFIQACGARYIKIGEYMASKCQNVFRVRIEIEYE